MFTLGADVPTDALPAVVREFKPTLFALSATMPETGAYLRGAVQAVTCTDPRVGLILGGESVPLDLVIGPRVTLEPSVAGIVDAADGLIRGAGLN